MSPSVSLSVHSVYERIDGVLASTNPRLDGVVLQRVQTQDDWNTVLSAVASQKRSEGDAEDPRIQNKNNNTESLSCSVRPPFCFGILAVKKDPSKPSEPLLVGFCTFYIAYSTWDGRMMYVDQIQTEADGSLLLYLVVARIATKIGCARFTWKQKERPRWNTTASTDPEFLEDWILLSMDRLAMTNFVESPPKGGKISKRKSLHRECVEEFVKENLAQQQEASSIKSNGNTITLRLAGPRDARTIARLVKQLAVYEKEPDAVNVTAEDYFLDGYNSAEEPLFYCILADVAAAYGDEAGKTTAAMGLFYFGHNLVDGPFLYLEDLFCDEAFRGKGVGTAIMKQLARTALSLDCTRFIWTALDWNTPALSFYNKIGAATTNDTKITRYCGEHLKSFADSIELEEEYPC